MADSPYQYVRNQIRDNLRTYERLSFGKRTEFVAQRRRVSEDSIKRLEKIITIQEDRVKKIRHQSGGSPSQTHRLRASMKDLLTTYRHTLQRIRASAETLELSWTILSSAAQPTHGPDHGC